MVSINMCFSVCVSKWADGRKKALKFHSSAHSIDAIYNHEVNLCIIIMSENVIKVDYYLGLAF